MRSTILPRACGPTCASAAGGQPMTLGPGVGTSGPCPECREPVCQPQEAGRRREGQSWAHDIVRIIELLICTGLAAAVTGMFAIAVIGQRNGNGAPDTTARSGHQRRALF